jgi:hypothetical protein
MNSRIARGMVSRRAPITLSAVFEGVLKLVCWFAEADGGQNAQGDAKHFSVHISS